MREEISVSERKTGLRRMVIMTFVLFAVFLAIFAINMTIESHALYAEVASSVESSLSESSSSSAASSVNVEEIVKTAVNNIMSTKVYGTMTVGALIFGVIEVIIYWVLHYGTKGDIKKALSTLTDAKRLVSESQNLQADVKVSFDEILKEYASAKDDLKEANANNAKLIEQLKALKTDFNNLKGELDSQKNILLTMAKSDAELVKSGTYAKITETLGGKTDGK